MERKRVLAVSRGCQRECSYEVQVVVTRGWLRQRKLLFAIVCGLGFVVASWEWVPKWKGSLWEWAAI